MGHEAPPPLRAPVSASRPSAADREWVIRRLRSNCENERLSLDTFSARVELAYAAQSRTELVDLLFDLPSERTVARTILKSVAWLSWWTARLQAAWRNPRIPMLLLPLRGTVVLGRSRDCACVLGDPTVSRKHALLRHSERTWWLRDLGSTNGTYVNGSRLVDEIEVRPGDEVRFGAATYRLTLASARSSHTHRLSRPQATTAA
jgi:FHA domain/Domain of unknown function (DUF1707)